MNVKKKLVVLMAVFYLASGPALAACGGTIYTDGCGQCGFLYLSKYKWFKKQTAYRDGAGNCQTQTTTTSNSCGSC
jgi:hypothetical protein